MRKKRKHPTNDSLRFAGFFIIFVLFLILGSIFIKGLSLYQKSKFDGAHRFTVLVKLQKEEKIVSFSPDNNSISILKILQEEETQILNRLSIPIDEKILLKEANSNHNLSITLDNKNIKSGLLTMIFSYNAFDTNMTVIDLIRLWFFTLSVPSHAVTVKELSLKSLDLNKQFIIDSIAAQFFIDYAVSKERQSIQIINGTDIAGLGNKLAKVISNMGGNVVSVATSNSILSTSAIAYSGGDKTYTLKKLSSLFNLKIEQANDLSVSDIVITLGKDKPFLPRLKI